VVKHFGVCLICECAASDFISVQIEVQGLAGTQMNADEIKNKTDRSTENTESTEWLEAFSVYSVDKQRFSAGGKCMTGKYFFDTEKGA
jgi:hypothetical protein